MSEAAIHDVVQEFLGGNSLTDEDDGELLRFVIQGLRSSSVAVAKASVQGLLDLLRSEGNRAVIKASPAASAAKALHFLHPELSSLAGRLCDELEDFIGDPTQRHQENWLTFTYPRQPLESLVLKVKLSEAKEAEVLSSHGWRVWPGAQLLAGFMVSEPDWLVGTKILEVGAGPGLCGLAAAALGAAEVTLSDRCRAVRAALEHSVKENSFTNVKVVPLDWEARYTLDRYDVALASEVIYQKPAVEMLPKLLLQVLKPGGIFCACEQAGRCQDGVDLLPLFWEQMELLGFHLLLKDAKQMEARDEKYLLFKFVLRT